MQMRMAVDLERKKKMLVGYPLQGVVVASALVSAAVLPVFLDYPLEDHGLGVYNIQSRRRRRRSRQHIRKS